MKKKFCTPKCRVIKININAILQGSTTPEGDFGGVPGDDAKGSSTFGFLFD